MTAKLTARTRFLIALSPGIPPRWNGPQPPSPALSTAARNPASVTNAAAQAQFLEVVAPAMILAILPRAVQANPVDFTGYMQAHGHPLFGNEGTTTIFFLPIFNEAIFRINRWNAWLQQQVGNLGAVVRPPAAGEVRARTKLWINLVPIVGRGSIRGFSEFAVMRGDLPILVIELKRFEEDDATFRGGEAQALLSAAVLAERHDLPSVGALVCDFERWRFLRVDRNRCNRYAITTINHGADHRQPPTNADVEHHVQLLVTFLTDQ